MAQVYQSIKALQARVDALESENRESKQEVAKAKAEAAKLRQKLGLSQSTPAMTSAPPGREPIATKVAAPPPRETFVTAVTEPTPHYYTVGVTPFATLQPGAGVVPGVVPIQVLPTGRPEFDNLTSALRLGNNILFQPYGTLTASYSHDSSSPYGQTSVFPGFIGNINGPSAFPATHINARDSIFGATTMWRDLWGGLSVTGKFEFDLAGNFAAPSLVSISSAQANTSYSPRIRLAYGRADLPVTSSTNLFLLAGQDWTPFASSTLPHLLDTEALGVGFGNIWARAPQVRAGVSQELGTPLNFLVQLEGAVVQPNTGNVPLDATAVNLANQLSFGERQGADSDRPEIQGRGVLQFQLDPAPGVAPAQLIASGMVGQRTAIVQTVPASFQAAFPNGTDISTTHYGWTVEAQLPTRYFTVSAKYYEGRGLHAYGGGQLFSPFNNIRGLTGTATASSIDGSSTLVFGLNNGVPVVASQTEPRSQGGFVTVGLPFSRWLGADPKGFNAGWTGYVTAGHDQVPMSDVLSLGGGRRSGDIWAADLEYRPIENLIFGLEYANYQTNAVPLVATGQFPLFQGSPMSKWTDHRVTGVVSFAY